VADRAAALQAAPGGKHLVGLHHPVAAEPDPASLLRPEVRRGLAADASARLAVDLELSERELPSAYETCRSLPELRCVIDHLVSPPLAPGDLSAWGRELLPLAELHNVSAKVPGLVTQAERRTVSIDDLRHPVELAVDAFGADRTMSGSEWPHCLLAGSYVDVIRCLLSELPAHEVDAIEGATAVRVYRLAQHVR
jgi:L-fuconolactonase